MKIPSRETVEAIRRQYPEGTRIQVVQMHDRYNPVPPGTKGTVRMVDDMGTIHPIFDNGRTLGLIVDADDFIIIENEVSDT